MSTALKLELAQQAYDNRQPAESADESAERQWVENGVEELMRCGDVQFKRAGQTAQGLTFDQFAVAVDEFVMQRLGRSDASQSALGRAVIGIFLGQHDVARQGASDCVSVQDPKGMLREIAEGLLRPLARDGVIAEQEESL